MTTPLSDEWLGRYRGWANTFDTSMGYEQVRAGAHLAWGAPALLAEVDRLRARVAELEGVLRSVEHVVMLEHYIRPEWNEDYCPECYAVKPDHKDGCALDAALRSGTDAE